MVDVDIPQDGDDELIDRIKRGDSAALADFIENRRPQLTAFIERNLSDALRRKIEAADIIQELSINAVDSVDEMELGSRDPFSWLCQLAERRIIDAHRRFFGAQKRSGSKERALDARGENSQQAGFIDVLVASMTTPSRAFSRNQKELRLLVALESLPEDARNALRMRYVEGLPSKEIAEKLGKTDGATRVLLTRSLARLQEILSGDSEFQSFLGGK